MTHHPHVHMIVPGGGIALLLMVGGVVVREINWLAWPLTFFAIFVAIWGRAPTETQRLIAQLPGGKFLLKGFDGGFEFLGRHVGDAHSLLRLIGYCQSPWRKIRRSCH